MAPVIEWLDRRRKAKAWRIVRQWDRPCWWTDANRSAGRIIIVGEQNGLSQRRVRIVAKPEAPWNPKHTTVWYDAMRWATEPSAGTFERPKLRVVK
jgi:hypothetical protein